MRKSQRKIEHFDETGRQNNENADRKRENAIDRRPESALAETDGPLGKVTEHVEDLNQPRRPPNGLSKAKEIVYTTVSSKYMNTILLHGALMVMV